LGAKQVIFAADLTNMGGIFTIWDEDRMYPGSLGRGLLGMCFSNCATAQKAVLH